MFLLSLLTNKESYNTQIIQCANDTIFRKRFRVPGFGTGSGTSEPVPWNRFLRQITSLESLYFRDVIFGRSFIKRFAISYRPVVCLPVCPVCLPVTLVYCDQTDGWIKMKLGTEIGLSPGHNVLDGHPAPSSQKGHSPSPIFGPYMWTD